MTFNTTGKFIKTQFYFEGKPLEYVSRFCYLGFEICSSGTVTHAMNVLLDKAKKAMRPVMNAIAKFDLPTSTAIKLFSTYVSPIILYNVENWAILSEKNILKTDEMQLFNMTFTSTTDTLHRKFLRYVLGLNNSTPNLALYGETGEIPLSLKGYRLMINYWKRLTTLPDQSLAKKALIENVGLRTNWIRTIEKLLKTFKLIDVADNKFKKKTRENIDEFYVSSWKNKMRNENSSRLHVYKTINCEFSKATHLDLPFPLRKIISKIRCSTHSLEIEKGRHSKTAPLERFCIICQDGSIENENHFLIECASYENLKDLFNLQTVNLIQVLNSEDQSTLGKYLLSAFRLRDRLINGRRDN